MCGTVAWVAIGPMACLLLQYVHLFTTGEAIDSQLFLGKSVGLTNTIRHQILISLIYNPTVLFLPSTLFIPYKPRTSTKDI